MECHLIINTSPIHLDVDPERSLLSLLRDDLGLTGAKYGCGDGKCGACTILLDGQPVQACSVTAGELDNRAVTTVEGLAGDGKLHPVQQAILDADALQCGYCTPGMVMSAVALLASNPSPTRDEVIHAMQDNICRCGVYQRLVDAILAASEALAGGPAESVAIADDHRPQDPFSRPLTADQPEGIVVAFACEDVALSREEAGFQTKPLDQLPPSEIGPWVHIDEVGDITAYAGKAEVGQNIRTSLAQIVAEELRVPAASVEVILGDTARTPYDRGTFGSRTTPITGRQLFKVGAATRGVLLDLAAANWGVEGDALTIADGRVEDPDSGLSASFGEIARDRQLLTIVGDNQGTTPAKEWQTAGQPIPKFGAAAFVTGAQRYASDLSLPGMLHAKILRPPAFHATLVDLDASAAEAMPGVSVVRDDGLGDSFVGVTAPDPLTAERAVESLRARWKTELQLSQPELFDYLKANPDQSGWGKDPFQKTCGSVEEALAAADVSLNRRYTVDFIAHTPMEPRTALASWEGDRLTVWTGSQRPFGIRVVLADLFGLPVDHVRVVVPDTGSGFGGKHAGDAAVEAVRLARVVGKPIKLVWTREEEFTWAVFRPAGLIEVASAATPAGKITALEFHNYNSGAAGIETVYEIPNQHIEFHPADSPLREGAYRALSTTANTFARETHLDELARLLGIDALDLRLLNLSDERQIAVLSAVAETFGWGATTLPAGHGVGIACGFDKGGYVAACAEVHVDSSSGALRVLRVVEAFECGAITNPANLRNQMEGAIVQGLGGALFESIKFANGRILNPNFTGYRVPRFADAPLIETVLINRPDLPPAGAGETPIIAVAPAVGNAIFDACGVRLRAMPMASKGVV